MFSFASIGINNYNKICALFPELHQLSEPSFVVCADMSKNKGSNTKKGSQKEKKLCNTQKQILYLFLFKESYLKCIHCLTCLFCRGL